MRTFLSGKPVTAPRWLMEQEIMLRTGWTEREIDETSGITILRMMERIRQEGKQSSRPSGPPIPQSRATPMRGGPGTRVYRPASMR